MDKTVNALAESQPEKVQEMKMRGTGKVLKMLAYGFFCGLLTLVVLCGCVLAQQKIGQSKPELPTNKKNSIPGVEDNNSLRINTDLVSFAVIVTDREGNLVTGLQQNDFTVYDNGILQEIAFFSEDDDPASVVVVFDTSASMSGKKIAQAKEALARLIETSHPRDEFFLIGFNSRPQLLLDSTRDAEALLAKLAYVEPRGETALYDAVYLGVEKVLRGAHPKKVVLMITDGEDNNSQYAFTDVKQQLQESGVICYAVGILKGMSIRQRVAGEEVLKKLATDLGGNAFFPDDKLEMDETFERIAVELRRRYSIGFQPANFIPDGKWHRLKVEVAPDTAGKKRIVRTRKGYYARISSR